NVVYLSVGGRLLGGRDALCELCSVGQPRHVTTCVIAGADRDGDRARAVGVHDVDLVCTAVMEAPEGDLRPVGPPCGLQAAGLVAREIHLPGAVDIDAVDFVRRLPRSVLV